MPAALDLGDIQGTVLRARPMPYFGSYLLFRIDEAEAARTFLRRLLPQVTSAADWERPAEDAWINLVFSAEGLRRLGVGEAVLAGFPPEFRQGMAARARFLGDVGPSGPSEWDMPHGGTGFHAGILIMAGSEALRDAKLAIGRAALAGLGGVALVGRIDIAVPPTLREHFGYADGISRPFIAGEGGSPLPGQGAPAKAGEFILGHENELGLVAAAGGPPELWRNGTFVALRKIRQHVAVFRAFLRDNAAAAGGEEMLAAKLMGRWRSGSPLALAPAADLPDLAADIERNNAFGYADDLDGRITPAGCHIRRVNPRDALDDSLTDVRLHRVLRRGAAYGPPLPEDATEDDGADRGIVLAMINADPGRQFEFVQSQWINDGDFISQGARSDPIVGRRDLADDYLFPARPVRRRVGLRDFTVVRGGEHVFLPGLGGLAWLAGNRG